MQENIPNNKYKDTLGSTRGERAIQKVVNERIYLISTGALLKRSFFLRCRVRYYSHFVLQRKGEFTLTKLRGGTTGLHWVHFVKQHLAFIIFCMYLWMRTSSVVLALPLFLLSLVVFVRCFSASTKAERNTQISSVRQRHLVHFLFKQDFIKAT